MKTKSLSLSLSRQPRPSLSPRTSLLSTLTYRSAKYSEFGHTCGISRNLNRRRRKRNNIISAGSKKNKKPKWLWLSRIFRTCISNHRTDHKTYLLNFKNYRKSKSKRYQYFCLGNCFIRSILNPRKRFRSRFRNYGSDLNGGMEKKSYELCENTCSLK
ncbi:hypothetical protein K501DRAFT_271353 [Backusella circina FSU 941]|nr:hypothetical protein K501DRAFT_271353 [Backusella circina FSU 941]